MNVSFTFFNNYHAAAKEFAQGDMAIYGRLMYVLNCYAIDGEVPEDLTPVEKLFLTSIKASVDKSIRLSEAGRKGGKAENKNSENEAEETNTQNNDFSELKNEACKPLKMACNEEEEEKEIELDLEVEEEKEIEREEERQSADSDLDSVQVVLFDSDLNLNQKNILNWFIKNEIKLTPKNKDYIFMIAEWTERANVNSVKFLDYVLGIVKSVYHKVNPGIIYNAFSWENTLCGFQAVSRNEKKETIPKPPESCDSCGAKLVPGGMLNTVLCPKCTEAGHRTWFEFDKKLKKWKKVE